MDSSDEQTLLLHKRKGWTTHDVLLFTCNVFVRVVFAVATNLAGVIGQQVSCELHLTGGQEGWLNSIIYIGLAAGYVLGGVLGDALGRRPTVLLSLYMSLGSGILTALFPTYPVVMATFAMFGFAAGMVLIATNVHLAESVSRHSVYVTSAGALTLTASVVSCVLPLVGFFSLDSISWRYFALVTICVPCVPALLMHHLLFRNDTRDCSFSKAGCGSDTQNSEHLQSNFVEDAQDVQIQTKDTDTDAVPRVWLRVLKLGVYIFSNMCQGWGAITLVPVLLRLNNQEDMLAESQEPDDGCATAIHGLQFILLIVINGGDVIGRAAAFFFLSNYNVPFRLVNSIMAVLMIACYGALLWDHSILVIVVSMTLAKLFFSWAVCEFDILAFDPEFLGRDTVAVAAGLVSLCEALGGVVGNVLAGFLTPHIAVAATFGLGFIKLFAIFSMTEVKRTNK